MFIRKRANYSVSAAVVALALGGSVLFGVEESASAHAQLLVANPAVGATLTSSPSRVSLTFDDDLIDIQNGNQLSVQDPSGKNMAIGGANLQGAVLSVALAKLTVFGKYQVTFHVISADGHPVTSQYPFYFQKPAKASPSSKAKSKALSKTAKKSTRKN